MNRDEARALLVGARKTFDDAAKKIVDDFEAHDEALNREGDSARQKVIGEFTGSVGCALDRCAAALEQWEIAERVPLDKDDLFMDAFRDLLREAEDFRRGVVSGD